MDVPKHFTDERHEVAVGRVFSEDYIYCCPNILGSALLLGDL